MTTDLIQANEWRLKGVAICRGIGIGRPFCFGYQRQDEHPRAIKLEEITKEITRYDEARLRFQSDIERLRNQMLREDHLEGAAILEAHQQIINDPVLNQEVRSFIEQSSMAAENAFEMALNEYQRRFEGVSDPFFRERFKDIQDIAKRLCSHLRHKVRVSISDLPQGSVVFTKEISAYDAAEADSERIAGFVTEVGGVTTHAAIVAKSKGIPYVARVNFANYEPSQGDLVIVDARLGEVIIAPQPETLAVYRHVKEQMAKHDADLIAASSIPTETANGENVNLSANVETLEEVTLIHEYGAIGIGLLRSESIFLSNETLPDEEEQFRHYRSFVEKMKGLPIIIRTFDLGGDKSFMGRCDKSSELFFVGCRALSFLLHERAIFKRQLRAILRASQGEQVSVLFPMVTSLTDLRDAKSILAEATQELLNESAISIPKVRCGCMIEVPAAAIISDLLARECDFLSIGTNDLVHYSLAVERSYQTNSSLESLCHPGILRMIAMAVKAAQAQKIPISICGEIASSPRFIPLLLGLGIREFSVACRYIPLIKHTIRSTNTLEAQQLVEQAFTLNTREEIQELLLKQHPSNMAEEYFYL